MQRGVSRRRALLGAGSLLAGSLAGCLGPPSGAAARARARQPPADAPERFPPFADSRLPLGWSLETLAAEQHPGGPPKDGIPSIDDPVYTTVDGASSFLADRDIVFGAVRAGDAVAYPRRILAHHEILNGELGGDPVAVTYCPLTGTAMGFDRGPVTFGVSGWLVNNNLVMYDRGSDSRWPQVPATAVEGPAKGRSLREFRLVWTTFRRWQRAHPESRVLTPDTGFARNYRSDPYGSYAPPSGYYVNDQTFYFPLETDNRLHLKRVVVGTRTPAGTIAFLKDALRSAGVLTGSIGDTSLVAVFHSGLDTGYVYRNPENRHISFESGTVRVDGEPTPPADLPLPRSYAFDAMWFAWAGFYPETALVTAPSSHSASNR